MPLGMEARLLEAVPPGSGHGTLRNSWRASRLLYRLVRLPSFRYFATRDRRVAVLWPCRTCREVPHG
jgi:hypothetical protein